MVNARRSMGLVPVTLAAALAAALVLLRGPAAYAQNTPTLAHPVTDLADVLTPADESAIAARLVAHRASTGVHIAVLTVASTNGEPIEDFAHRVATTWRGGQQGRDNGVLFTLAVRDRRSRIDVGYGNEANLPDAEARRMLDAARPQLRANDYAGAVRGVVEQLIVRTGGTAAPAPTQPGVGGAYPPPMYQQPTYPQQNGWQQYMARRQAEELARAQRAADERRERGGMVMGLLCAVGFFVVIALLIRAATRRATQYPQQGGYYANDGQYHPYGPGGGGGISPGAAGGVGFGAGALLGYLAGSRGHGEHHHHHHDSSGSSYDSGGSSSGWDSGSSSSSGWDSGGGSSSWDSGSSSSNDSGWSGGGGDFGGGGASSDW